MSSTVETRVWVCLQGLKPYQYRTCTASSRGKTYVTVNSCVCPEAVNVLTNVSSNVTVIGWEMVTVSVAVAVGATVLIIVVKPDDAPSVLVSGGAPPEGSMTIVPGRFDTGMVMSPLPAVTVMISPAVGVAVAVTVSVTLEVAVALPVTSDVAVPVAFTVAQ